MQISFVEKLLVSIIKLRVNIKKIARERHKIAHEPRKLLVSVTKLSVNVCSDTKCILVPIKLLVVRLPRLRLPGVILGGDTKMSALGVTHPSYATERE